MKALTYHITWDPRRREYAVQREGASRASLHHPELMKAWWWAWSRLDTARIVWHREDGTIIEDWRREEASDD